MTNTYDQLNSKLPRFTKTYRKGLKFQTWFGPNWYNCSGTVRPMLHAFCTPFSGSVFFVCNCGDFGFEEGMRWAFYNKAEPINGKTKKIRKLTYRGIEVKVFYSRKAAVTELARLVDIRKAENAAARKAHADAVAAGDHATAAEYC